MDLDKLFEDYVNHGIYLRGWDSKTTAIYRRAFENFREGLIGIPLEHESELSKTHLETWVVWMRKQERAPAYINIHLRAFNAFCHWLHEEGHTKQRLKLRRVPDPVKPIPMFSDTEIQLILKWKPKLYGQQRLYAIIVLLHFIGRLLVHSIPSNISIGNGTPRLLPRSPPRFTDSSRFFTASYRADFAIT